MSEPGKGGDPSMDEILASIRRIISDEPGQERPVPDRRALNPLIEPPRRPPGFIDLPTPRDARPLPPADRFSEALRASAITAPPPPPAAPGPSGAFDADLEDLLEGPPEPLAVEPARPAAPAAPAAPAKGSATAPSLPKPRDWTSWAGLRFDDKDDSVMGGKAGATAVESRSSHTAGEAAAERHKPGARDATPPDPQSKKPDPAAEAAATPPTDGDQARAIAAALSGTAAADLGKPQTPEASPAKSSAPVVDAEAAAAAPAPQTPAVGLKRPVAYTLDSFPSLPGDGASARAGLSKPSSSAPEAPAPREPGAFAVPLTPAEASHATKIVNGAANAPAEAAPGDRKPAAVPAPVPSYLADAPKAVPASPAGEKPQGPAVALDRDTQAAAAMALGALAAGLAAAPSAGALADVPATAHAAAPAAPAPAAPAVAAPSPSAPAAVAAAPEQAAPSRAAARTLEDIIADMARPMLEKWIADNMPRIMEKALRGELKSKKP